MRKILRAKMRHDAEKSSRKTIKVFRKMWKNYQIQIETLTDHMICGVDSSKSYRRYPLKKLINPIQGAIIVTGWIAAIMFLGRIGSYDLDAITTEQFLFGQAVTALYIAFVWAVYRVLENIKEGPGYGNIRRPHNK